MPDGDGAVNFDRIRTARRLHRKRDRGSDSVRFDFSPILAGAIIAALWQILVIFGIHWGSSLSF